MIKSRPFEITSSQTELQAIYGSESLEKLLDILKLFHDVQSPMPRVPTLEFDMFSPVFNVLTLIQS